MDALPREELSEQDWQTLDSAVAQLEAVWRLSPNPSLRQFVPATEGSLRLRILVELIKVDHEHRLRRGQSHSMESYLAEWPVLQSDPDLMLALVEAECVTRALRGERPTRLELRKRFPELEPRVALDTLLAECDTERQQIASRDTLIFQQHADDTLPIPAGILEPAQRADEIGRLGHYRILHVLGSGGMGVVFHAEDERLGRAVAVKTLKRNLAANPEFRRRFLREARAAAQLTHDHVVTIHQVDESQGVPFMAMQLLVGETLEERLQRLTTLPITEVLRIGCEIADALAAAHAHGLVHRDVKPANIWLEKLEDREDRVKLLDFGLAHLSPQYTFAEPVTASAIDLEHSDGLTRPGEQMGTPAYMAPEVSLGQSADSRGDLFSLGCVLYRCVTGVLPFTDRDPLARGIAPNSSLARNVLHRCPASLGALIQKLLARNPSDRPLDSSSVLEELRRIGTMLVVHRQRTHRTLAALAAGATLIGVTMWMLTGGKFNLRPATSAMMPTLTTSLPAVRFAVARQYAVGRMPFDTATVDLNRDDCLDLIVSNSGSHSLSILLGNGDGRFSAPTNLETGRGPMGLVVGDFNEDRRLDLAVALAEDNVIAIHLGRDNTVFEPGQRLAVGLLPRGMEAADFDRDGHLDLATSNSNATDLSVWYGVGDGTFERVSTLAVQEAPAAVNTSDLNRDGQLDLIASNGSSDSISVLLGDGPRRFQLAKHFGVGSGPGMLAIADFNRDDTLDVAVENFGSSDVSILLGHSDGTFRKGGAFSVGTGPGGIEVGDFNGDGQPDLVVANHLSCDVSLLLGRPDGTFAPAVQERVGDTPVGIAVGDFDRDGRLDFAVANHLSECVSVVLNPKPRGYLRVAMPQRMNPDTTQTIVVQAVDVDGKTINDFRGTVHFSSDDPRATLPDDYQFIQADEGSHSFRISFGTLGPRLLEVACDSPDLRGGSVILIVPTETAPETPSRTPT